MAKPNINAHPMTVVAKHYVTPNMLRITLKSPAIHDYPENHASGYIKLVFPQGESRPLVRTYTIRAHRQDEIDVDFAIHQDGGPACTWAMNCVEGDTILIGGPGPKKLAQDSNQHLFMGDMTSLPAISVNLASLDKAATGHVAIEITSEQDQQELEKPAGVQVHWLVNPHPGENSPLLGFAKQLTMDWEQVSIWAACEFSAMRQLRQHFIKDMGIDRRQVYISSYWKHGISEDQHKIEKRQDEESAA